MVQCCSRWRYQKAGRHDGGQHYWGTSTNCRPTQSEASLHSTGKCRTSLQQTRCSRFEPIMCSQRRSLSLRMGPRMLQLPRRLGLLLWLSRTRITNPFLLRHQISIPSIKTLQIRNLVKRWIHQVIAVTVSLLGTIVATGNDFAVAYSPQKKS
jgi:hypothetical protein